MTYVTTAVVVVWICGALLLVGRALNFLRLVFNNLAPGKDSWTHTNFLHVAILKNWFRFDGALVDPESLTELGRQYQRGAIRNGRILLVWTVTGFLLLIVASPSFKGT